MTPDVNLPLTIADLLLEDEPPEGPEHKKWREKLRKAFGQRLREEGFTKNEILKILFDSLRGLKGIFKNLRRLYKVKRAYGKAKEDAGPEPPWQE